MVSTTLFSISRWWELGSMEWWVLLEIMRTRNYVEDQRMQWPCPSKWRSELCRTRHRGCWLQPRKLSRWIVFTMLIHILWPLFQLLSACLFFTVDGNWGPWNDGQCSKSCGPGSLSRTRECNDPAPQNGGQNCVGQSTEVVDCNLIACPSELAWSNPIFRYFHEFCPSLVDGNWGSWNPWSDLPCSTTCGPGTISRTRECNDPVPQHEGQACIGQPTETANCNLGKCIGE